MLTRFLFEGLPVRGVLVRLTDSWAELLRRRQTVGAYPAELRNFLGEMAAAAVLMQANIRFNGSLVMQIFGDGPVKLAVAEVQPDLSFRATATVVGDVPSRWTPKTNCRASSPIKAWCLFLVTSVSRCSTCSRCWSTTCCSLSSWIPA
jgi:redox-regulated HSP33 family molecular chaperone